MVLFWELVNKVISQADVLLVILDSRLVEETRNIEIEKKVENSGKPLIYVFTKCDLVEKGSIEKYKKRFKPSVFVSATKHLGTTMLRDRILIEARRAGLTKDVKIGVLGYPNVGKSSLINALKGRKSAGTSNVSGYTKGIQRVRADNRIIMLDTPGVIPYLEKDQDKHAIIGAVDYNKTKDPDLALLKLMEMFPGKVESYYGIADDDPESALENIALKLKMLKKGGVPDLKRAARRVLQDWQCGKIK